MAKPTLSADIIEGLSTRRNYIANQVEKSTVGWATYNDAAGSSPIDGIGGSPSITWSLTTTNPILDSASFQLVKGASNRQGDGVSYDFTIARGHRYSVLQIGFLYELVSGTLVYGDITTADLRVFLYDTTNNVVIEPTNTLLDGSGKFVSEYQTTDSTSYRFIIHVASTSAVAYTVNFDRIEIVERELARGPMISDWASHTPSDSSYAWGTVSSSSFKWRRVGGEIEIQASLSLSSAVTGALTFTPEEYLPPGLSVDVSDLVSQTPCGGWFCDDASAANTADNASGVTIVSNSTGNLLFVLGTLSDDIVDATSPTTWASGDAFVFTAKVPIVGWGSNTILSSDSGTRAVVVSVVSDGSVSGTINTTIGTSTTVDLGTVVKDTHGLYNAGTTTIKESGLYYFSYAAEITGTEAADNTNESALLKNGTVVVSSRDKVPTTGLGFTPTRVSGLVECVSGDLLTIRTASSVGTPAFNTGTTTQHFELFKIQSPQSIGMADRVACKYTTSAGSSIANSTATFVDFGTKVYDTHGLVVGDGGGNVTTAGTGFRALIKEAGLYRCTITQCFAAATFAIADRMEVDVRKNNTVQKYMTRHGNGHTSMFLQESVSAEFEAVSGDYIQGAVLQNSGSSKSLIADGRYVQFELVRIG